MRGGIQTGRLQQRQRINVLQRTRKVVPLHKVNAALNKLLPLFCRLNAFGNHSERQPVGNTHYRLYDRQPFAVEVIDKRAVNLDIVDVDILDNRQTGVTGAEIINGKTYAPLLQGADFLRPSS